MKKIILQFLIIFSINSFIYSNSYIKDLLSNITIGLGFDIKSRSIAGVVSFENSELNSYGNGTFSLIVFPQYYIKSNSVEIFFSRIMIKNFFNENREYNIWAFPERFRIELSYKQLEEINNTWNKYLRVLVDTSQTYPTTCQAIVIDNLNIRDTPSLSGKKIGMLQKASEVTLYEQSKNQEEIDGEKNFWYKVKVDEETYGWVYGAYVRIFFEDPSLGYSDKEKILESIKD